MIVSVKKKRFKLSLWCPQCLLSFAVKKIARNAAKRSAEGKENFILTVPDKTALKSIVKAVKTAKKFHGKLDLVYVSAADGTKVKITL